jgi:hypothetical protein
MIDKRITARRNFKGGADMGTVSTPTRAATNKGAPNVSAGGASFNDLGPGPSGADYKRSRQEFVDNLNRNNASRFEPSFLRRTYKPVSLDTVGARNQLRNKGGIRNLFKALLGFAVPGASFLFNQGKQGITNINNALGDFREKFTGYGTQQEYDDARQQRINLNRINTIQNTLNTKYADGDYSNTDLDERLAALRSQMGIVPNTAEQDAQQFLDFGNDLAINTEQSIIPNQDITTYMAETNTPFYKPDTGINTLRFVDNNSMSLQPNYLMPNTNKQPILESLPQYASREYPFFPYSGSV